MSGAAGGPTKAWFPHWKPKPDAALRLFCFSYAGGSASVFHRWADLGPSVEVLSVQYPGRETRFHDPPMTRLSALVEALAPVMLPLLDRPFAFFGYSLGTCVSMLLTYWLRRSGGPMPRGLLMAAGLPPRLMKPSGFHQLPDDALIEEIRRYGGAPPAVLANRELMVLMLPIVRADLEMLETVSIPEEPPLDVPLSVWGGLEDPSPSPQDLEGWRDYTTQDFSLQLIPGGHFFILSAGEALREAVERTLIHWTGRVT